MKKMKNIHKIIAIVLLTFSAALNSQRTPTFTDVGDEDEYLGGGGQTSVTEDLTNKNYEVGDLTFNWNGTFAIETALLNDKILKAAFDERLDEWYTRQVNEIVKPAIEYKLGKKFKDFEEAKNALFEATELNNINKNLVPVNNKYYNLRNSGLTKRSNYVRDLKPLKIRESEIALGNINYSKYPFIEVNGQSLKDFTSASQIKTVWDGIYKSFEINEAESHINIDIYNTIKNNLADLNSHVLKLKNNYYNSFPKWDKLNFMQFLINYEEYKEQYNCGVCINDETNELFKKFKDIDIATSQVIENYAIDSREGGSSVFDEKYWEQIIEQEISKEPYYVLNPLKLAFDYFTFVKPKAQREHAKRKQAALNEILDNEISEERLAITNLVNEIELTNNQQINWMLASENLTQVKELIDLADSNRVNNIISSEVKNFIKQAIELERILGGNFTIQTTGLFPEELNGCCPGNCCPDNLIYQNDPIIKEHGLEPMQLAVDAAFNFIASTASTIGGDNWTGKRIRRIMKEMDIDVSDDISNVHLASLYKIRKRDGIVIVEQRQGFLKTMLGMGLTTLDLLAFISPSKGGSAFLTKASARITITKVTDYLRKIEINDIKIDNLINSLTNKAKFDLTGTGQYSSVGGHHPLAKISFKSDKFYDFKKAFSVPNNKLQEIWEKANPNQALINVHSKITGQQNSLYSAFAKKNKPLTIEKMAEIEANAMINIGIPEDVAVGWIIKALEDLKAQGVKVITNIPWNGIN